MSLLYRDGVLRARRHARQRRGRRGRHPQPAHDRRDPAADRRRAAAGRGARRGLHVAAGLHGAQRAAGGGRADHLHEPAQQRRGDDPPARPDLAAERPLSMWCYAIGVTEGLSLHLATGSRWSGCARTASASTGTSRSSAREDDGRRAVPALAAAPRRAGLRDRRRRGQGRRLRAAAPARRRGARPALGDRLEVPADDRGHAAERDQLERRQVRRPAPVRGARAGARRRRHGQGRDAAQRGGPRAQGRPPRRRRDRPARRRRDPAGHLARPARRRAPGPCAAAAGRRSAARSATRPRSRPRAPSSPAARTASARSAAGSC